MAVEKKVIIHDYKHDKEFGRVELHLRTEIKEDTSTRFGETRQFSVDAQTLRDRFNNNLDDFEAWAVNEHKMIEEVHPDIVAQLPNRKGKAIG